MKDCFVEVFVRCNPTGSDALKKAALIAATAVSAFMGLFFSPLFILLLIVCIFLDTYMFPRFNREFEYSYVNGDLDVAAVYSKQNRKDLETIAAGGAECIAPASSHRLDAYGQTFRTVDYTSGDAQKPCTAIVVGGEDKKKYLLELPDEILEDMRRRFPGRVYTD